MDGFEVMSSLEAASRGDFFVTVTGDKGCLSGTHFDVMKTGAVMANAGHFDVEISKPDLIDRAVSVRKVRHNVEEFAMRDGRKLYLLAEGRLVNLAAGDGHPAEVMDMTFGLQALALRLVAEGHLPAGVHKLPQALDERVASMRLLAIGVEIDSLTEEQEAYLHSWGHA